MKILFIVNDVAEMITRQATTLLVHAAAAAGHEVWVCGVGELHLATGKRLSASARRVPKPAPNPSRLAAGLRQQASKRLDVEACDAVMLRTNPGRDASRLGSHEVGLQLLGGAVERGTVVLNDPRSLQRAATKAYLTELPAEVVPPLIVSRSPEVIKEWLQALGGPAVLKPVRGTRGQDVFIVEDHEPANLSQIIDVIRRDGYVMAQAFVPEGRGGDVRVLVVDGEILEVDGRAAAVARIPASGDFRSNIAAGGRPAVAEVDDDKRASVARIADQLRSDGLFFVGIDFIADQIIELNVFSPGGLGNASEQQDRDFAGQVVRAIERYVADVS